MQKLMVALTLAAVAGSASATTFTFSPKQNVGIPADIFDLNHHNAYSWGINFAIPTGEKITGATLQIMNIWDWKVETDMLFIDLLDDPKKGVQTYVDNSADNVISDYWATRGGVALTTFSDPVGGHSTHTDFTYNFTLSQLALLTSFVTDPYSSSTKSSFGLAFDPDCHYYNDGVKFSITTAPTHVPDGGASAILAGGALLAIAAFRHKTK